MGRKSKPKNVDTIKTITGTVRVKTRVGEWTDFNPALLYRINNKFKYKQLRYSIISLKRRLYEGSDTYIAKIAVLYKKKNGKYVNVDKRKKWKRGSIIQIDKKDILTGEKDKKIEEKYF